MPKRVNEGNLTSITTSSTTAMTESSDIYDSALEVSEEIECDDYGANSSITNKLV